MFFAEDRITAMREMILSRTKEQREKALAKLLPMQRSDFIGLFEAMEGDPVTIRLLDPPLHEFLPKEKSEMEHLAKLLNISLKDIEEITEKLHEQNPMLGHRGCRLAVTYPEIQEMQVRAIIEAAIDVSKSKKFEVVPEIMIPIVCELKEFKMLKELAIKTIEKVFKEKGVTLKYMIGTMIEIPRAALTADKIATEAEFFSFGTNDLTQMTFGFSRDDIGTFLPEYLNKSIFEKDPFQVLDREGVGQLVKLAVERGRGARHNLKVGICGEHGGEPNSIEFCHLVGLNYVSCSPYRVPIARLAAADAALKN
jgi:pyruvate, orthophosphate dikinase